MINSFNTFLADRPSRNSFNTGNNRKMSFKMGYIVPTYWNEILPGDTYNISSEAMLRFAPLVAPVMDDVRVKIDWWAVPNRLLWKNWEKFISPDTEAERALVQPYIKNNTGSPYPLGSLACHMGLPVQNLDPDEEINALPFMAYELIWDEYYKDQNLQDGSVDLTENILQLVDGDNTLNYSQILAREPRRKAWDKDKLTSLLPWAQKGEQVRLPLTESGELQVENSANNATPIIRKTSDGQPLQPTPPDNEEWLFTSVGGFLDGGQNAANSQAVYIDPNGSLVVNLNANSATINELREAFALQRFYELDGHGGTRYQENIYAHFGVRGRDARFQRPEFIGRIKGKMVFSEVLQTAPSTVDTVADPTPLGTMGGHGISVTGGGGLRYRATEHGILMAFISVMPKATYSQGLPRKFSRKTRLDHYWPKLAHIGEHPVLYKEVKADHAQKDEEFGYAPVWSEYRYHDNEVSGDFRDSLDHFHLARKFDTDPGLNGEFITGLPTTRIFAVQYEEAPGEFAIDHIWGLIYNNVRSSRLMPKFGKPI